MCGIVGLFLKNPALEPKLGAMLSQMLAVMCDRGPDSAGFAVYGRGDDSHLKLSLRSTRKGSLDGLAEALSLSVGAPVQGARRDTHLVISFPIEREHEVRAWLARERPDLTIVSAGTRMEMYKEVGLPTDVAARFRLKEMRGTHGIGHTRMATESAVTTAGAHPFSTGRTNASSITARCRTITGVRRKLIREGLTFATENDTEVAAGYLTWRHAGGRQPRAGARSRA